MLLRTTSVRVSTICVLSLAVGSAGYAEAPPDGPQSRLTVPHIAAQLLIKPVSGVAQDRIDTLLAPYGGAVLDFDPRSGLFLAEVADRRQWQVAVPTLDADPQVEFAQPNFVFSVWDRPNDARFPEQWSKENLGINAPGAAGYAGADMNMAAAWETGKLAPNVIVAIIDDAVEVMHSDLRDNVLSTGKCFASPHSARPCTNGPDDPNPIDSSDFHGTLVTGAAAARGNNLIGVAGAAWEAGILPLKVDLSSFAIVQAIDEAIAQDADIVNLSFGGPVASEAQQAALDRAEAAGLLVVAAAGNADASNGAASHYPSDYGNPNVLSVAATTSQDRMADFSQWGSFAVDLAAPGQTILSTAINDGYAFASGTSFAAPHIAGVAALIKAHTGAPDYRQIKAHLLHGGVNGRTETGSAPTPGFDKTQVPGRVGSGRLDAHKALTGPQDAGVILVRSVKVDDTASGNGNGVLEPGETAGLVITLENVWQTETAVAGTLSTPDSDLLSIHDSLPVAFGTVAAEGQASAVFSATLASNTTGNQQLFLQLDLSSATTATLPSRYFYLEVGYLNSGETVTQSIQRWDWDEFQRFYIDVPLGATFLHVSTSGSGDIDLLLRRSSPPEYLVTLGGGEPAFYYVDDKTEVSAGPSADESVSLTSPLPGIYHVVVLNYDQAPKSYDITATYTTPDSDSVFFAEANYQIGEKEGEAAITVSRSGAVGEASVEYRTAPGSATADADYSPVGGTLTWAAGETGDRTFTVPIIDDSSEEQSESLTLTLLNTTRTALGAPSSATLRISDDDVPASRGDTGEGSLESETARSGGGGGGSISMQLLWLLVVLALLHRRTAERSCFRTSRYS